MVGGRVARVPRLDVVEDHEKRGSFAEGVMEGDDKVDLVGWDAFEALVIIRRFLSVTLRMDGLRITLPPDGNSSHLSLPFSPTPPAGYHAT